MTEPQFAAIAAYILQSCSHLAVRSFQETAVSLANMSIDTKMQLQKCLGPFTNKDYVALTKNHACDSRM